MAINASQSLIIVASTPTTRTDPSQPLKMFVSDVQNTNTVISPEISLTIADGPKVSELSTQLDASSHQFGVHDTVDLLYDICL